MDAEHIRAVFKQTFDQVFEDKLQMRDDASVNLPKVERQVGIIVYELDLKEGETRSDKLDQHTVFSEKKPRLE